MVQQEADASPLVVPRITPTEEDAHKSLQRPRTEAKLIVEGYRFCLKRRRNVLGMACKV